MFFQFYVLLICSLIFGSVIGSYFTTAEYRIRNELALITFYCYCPKCGHELALIHQIPIVSWIFQRGKCHYCKASISIRYPIIEATFILYYGFAFVLFWRSPIILCSLWVVFTNILLVLRCRGHALGILKGMGIFLCWHFVYGSALYAVTGL